MQTQIYLQHNGSVITQSYRFNETLHYIIHVLLGETEKVNLWEAIVYVGEKTEILPFWVSGSPWVKVRTWQSLDMKLFNVFVLGHWDPLSMGILSIFPSCTSLKSPPIINIPFELPAIMLTISLKNIGSNSSGAYIFNIDTSVPQRSQSTWHTFLIYPVPPSGH